MSASRVVGVLLVLVAIVCCLLLGTVGWFALGFGILTDCTNNYSCSESGCSPCAATGRWIDAGGVAQLLLAGVGFTVLVRSRTVRRRATLPLVGAALLVASLLTVVGTTWRADESYCQPGTPGYARSYCPVDA